MVASSFHNFAIRRSVYNPLERAHVKGITNYVDIGFQLTARRVQQSYADPQAMAAIPWQLNKNLWCKARLSNKDCGVVVGVKSWTTPSLSVCGSLVYDLRSKHQCLGLCLSVENYGDVTYQKAARRAMIPSKWEPSTQEAVNSETLRMPADQREMQERMYEAVPARPQLL
eukprot:NODE_3330_length_988_cov_26.569106_g3184_i0.p1 GENE.NODE_3330_length_988_cov_26.569106_g3184_i0~~NODE_3330_length_988_cov_26.569106_g3184_i0.p1  ORF type:complete len:170 (+),score=29.34 NODE_3330_length_988_cov_26.569106_g3184_i0:388-897(+)